MLSKLLIALAVSSFFVTGANATDMDVNNSGTFGNRTGGELSATFEDSEHFGYSHYLLNAGISTKLTNNIIGQINLQYSNYTDEDYPVWQVMALLGYQFTDEFSAGLYGRFEDFDGTEYVSVGVETKYATNKWEFEWGSNLILTEDGDSYDGFQTILVGSYRVNDQINAIGSLSYTDDDGDVYNVVGIGARWAPPVETAALDGVFFEGMGYLGRDDDAGDSFTAFKLSIGKEFGSGLEYRQKGWFEGVPAWW